jgi:uncharacterized damage-inducible protein DinB
MRTVTELITLFDYHYWANGRLFPVLAGLSDEQFTRDVAGSYGSIRNTLVHMMSAEAGWLDRCGGPPRGERLNPMDFPTLESVQRRWALYEEQMRQFLGSLSDADLLRPVVYTIPIPPRGIEGVGRVGELLHHAAIHNIHHRGQVSLLVRALGHVPGNFDILFYYSERDAAV